MTNANMKFVVLNVEFGEEEKKVPDVEQVLDEGEFIVKRVVELDKLSQVLAGM